MHATSTACLQPLGHPTFARMPLHASRRNLARLQAVCARTLHMFPTFEMSTFTYVHESQHVLARWWPNCVLACRIQSKMKTSWLPDIPHTCHSMHPSRPVYGSNQAMGACFIHTFNLFSGGPLQMVCHRPFDNLAPMRLQVPL